MLEYWVRIKLFFLTHSITPLLHHSNGFEAKLTRRFHANPPLCGISR
jgi:hypothetical protein